MHVAHEILAEGDEEQNAEDAAQSRGEKHLEERGCHLGIFGLQDVDGRQREDGSGHNGARAGSDALDDDILTQRVVTPGCCRHTHGYNGYWDGGLEHLTHLEAEVGSGGREENGHEDAPRDRPAVDFRVGALGLQHRDILFPLL